MSRESFIAYVGPPEIHDAHIVSLCRNGDELVVNLRGPEGEKISVTFSGTRAVNALRAEGMMLYSLSEIESDSSRKFVFANWDEADDASLEVLADSVSWGVSSA